MAADANARQTGDPAREAPRAGGLLSPKWIAGHLLALCLIALFVTAGIWQLSRLQERRAENRLIAQRMEAPAQPLPALAAEFEGRLAEAEFRSAIAQGVYDSEHEVLIRSRSHTGQPGYHLLTPLLLEGGDALLVDRGWVPYQYDDVMLAQAAPPQGAVEVTGRLLLEQDPPEGWGAAFAPRDPAEGELERVFYVDTDRLSAQMPFPLRPYYLELVAQDPAQAELPLTPPAPELDQGSHLSYAFQWFSFAAIGVIGYALLLRKTVRDGRQESRGKGSST